MNCIKTQSEIINALNIKNFELAKDSNNTDDLSIYITLLQSLMCPGMSAISLEPTTQALLIRDNNIDWEFKIYFERSIKRKFIYLFSLSKSENTIIL